MSEMHTLWALGTFFSFLELVTASYHSHSCTFNSVLVFPNKTWDFFSARHYAECLYALANWIVTPPWDVGPAIICFMNWRKVLTATVGSCLEPMSGWLQEETPWTLAFLPTRGITNPRVHLNSVVWGYGSTYVLRHHKENNRGPERDRRHSLPLTPRIASHLL